MKTYFAVLFLILVSTAVVSATTTAEDNVTFTADSSAVANQTASDLPSSSNSLLGQVVKYSLNALSFWSASSRQSNHTANPSRPYCPVSKKCVNGGVKGGVDMHQRVFLLWCTEYSCISHDTELRLLAKGLLGGWGCGSCAKPTKSPAVPHDQVPPNPKPMHSPTGPAPAKAPQKHSGS